MPWSPLGAGFLIGTMEEKTVFASSDIRGNVFPRFSAENRKAQSVVGLLTPIAAEKKSTPAQIALASISVEEFMDAADSGDDESFTAWKRI